MSSPTIDFKPDPTRVRTRKLFLASSSDVRSVRLRAFAVLGPLLNRLTSDHIIEPTDWETCIAEKPFDQRLTMQDNLMRPSDPDCIGLVCIMGERIGYPLRDFVVEKIPGWAEWSDPRRRYRAVYPWPDDQAEQLRQVMAGGFPVSGTVFEVLDALGAGRPTYACYLADRNITFHDPDVSLNSRLWQSSILLLGLKAAEASHWIATEYAVQTSAVSNFVNSLHDRSRHVPMHRTMDEAIAGICNFVKSYLANDTLIEDNPYRSLDFYDVYDAEDLYGREQKTREAIDELRARALGGPGAPMVARITGVSGCGKTSFLRAGILGGLSRPRELGRFKVLAVRPTDFHDENGHPDQVLVRLLGLIASEIREFESIPEVEINRVRQASHRAPEVTVKILMDVLDKLTTKESWLVIGLDQFEEVLDDLADSRQRRYAAQWRPLLSFVTATIKEKARIAFVYTLESSRFDLLSQEFVTEPFRKAYEIRLSGDDENFLESIITKPFGRAGYRLAPKIVNELLASYRKYINTMQGNASALPLLSLKLSNLFDFVQYLPRRADQRIKKEDGALSFDETSVEISYDDVKDHLRLDNDIEEMANEAWGESDNREEESLDDLDTFLQPLVALGGGNFDTITLLTVGDSIFVSFNERLERFLERRLVIRDNGRRRLVHEAVIRQWPLASKWLAYKRQYLIEEAKFRHDADYWALGKESPPVPADETSIETAAAILRSYFQEWPYANDTGLTPESRNLRKYCEAILAKSQTPAKPYTRYYRKPMSPIHIAAAYGMTDLVRRFIEQDSSCLNVLSGKKRTPLDNAAWVSAQTTQLLVDKGAEPVNFDEYHWPTLCAPVWTGNNRVFQILLPYYKTKESVQCPQDASLLHTTARRGAFSMAHALIHQIPDLDPNQLDANGRTPLHYAALHDQPEAFEFFLGYCDPAARDSSGFTVLHLAAAMGNNRVLDVILKLPEFYPLVETAANDGMNALMFAAVYRHAATVGRLCGVIEPNQQVAVDGPQMGWTALHFAISGQDTKKRETRNSRQQALQTVRTLLDVPAIDPNIKTAQGQTPISLAASIPLVQRELVAHAKFAWPELPDGATPLNFLIKTKDRYLVEKMLLTSSLDVEALSTNGDYALNLLIKNGMPDLALMLWDEGRVHPWHIEGTPDNGMCAAVSEDNGQLIECYFQTLPQPLEQSHRRQLGSVVRDILYQSKRKDLLPRLVESGLDPLSADKNGWNSLHVAAVLGDLDAFDRFARISATLDDQDTWGRTPLDLAPDATREQFAARFRAASGTVAACTPANFGNNPSGYLSFEGQEWQLPSQVELDLIMGLGPIDGRLSISPGTQVLWRDLPMFAGVKLFQVTDSTWQEDLRVCYLLHDGNTYRLNGTSPPIHEVNLKAAIKLTAENVLFYLSFFCFFVRGEDGPFYVLHSLNDPLLPPAFAGGRIEGIPAGRTLDQLLRSPLLAGVDSNGNFRTSSLVNYSNAIFHADIVVHSTGMVEMTEDRSLIAELSCKVQAPLVAPVRTSG